MPASFAAPSVSLSQALLIEITYADADLASRLTDTLQELATK